MFLSQFNFSKKRVLVTGGAQGIGKSISLKFLELNATVFILDKDEQSLNALKADYPSINTMLVDLQDWKATRVAVESILPIHHLANNAGIFLMAPFLDIDESHMDKMYDVNFKGALNVAQIVAKGMIEHGIKDGTIVSTGSIAASVATKNTAIYSAFKSALQMLTRTMAVELAVYGIRVNCILPGMTNTEILTPLLQDPHQQHFTHILQRMLFHRAIEPDEISNVFVFLSSKASASVTGIALAVDQGYSLQ